MAIPPNSGIITGSCATAGRAGPAGESANTHRYTFSLSRLKGRDTLVDTLPAAFLLIVNALIVAQVV